MLSDITVKTHASIYIFFLYIRIIIPWVLINKLFFDHQKEQKGWYVVINKVNIGDRIILL